MKIAVVSTIEEMVPPPAYGGIERVVALLERGLVERGHDVVLLASGGSQPRSRLVALTDRPLRGVAAPTSLDGVAVKEEAARRAASALDAEGADVVLNHMWRLLDHVRPNGSPIVTTTHYPLDVDPYRSIFQARRGWPFVSISRSQQREGPTLRFVANIYNGVDVRSFGTGAGDGGYLAFLGRLAPDKGADVALRVARAAGLPLRIAARAEATDPWARDNVLPLVQAGYGELVGELAEAQKADFLGRATALLHPSRWSEPFGLAAVEALACGTPVIATRVGALPEIVRDGVTGFVADTEEELARAARRSPTLSRSACRRDAEARFDYRRMVDEYEALAEREASG